MQQAMRSTGRLFLRVSGSQKAGIREVCAATNNSAESQVYKAAAPLLDVRNSLHTVPFTSAGAEVKDNKAAPKGGETTGYGSSQVEADRTGGKPQAGGPRPSEDGTIPRPAGNEQATRPRTGTTGDDGPDMRPGGVPPGYDEDKPRPANETEQMATDEMQGKGGLGFLGRDPTKDTTGSKPDYGKADPNMDEEELMQGGDRRPEKGQVGNYGNVDSGDMAGMPREQTPPSTSPAEHHPQARSGQGKPDESQSWDPASSTPDLDKDARVTDPRVSGDKRSGLTPFDGPSEGEPEPGSYAEELTENVRPNETPEGPQEVPPKVPGAIDPNQPKD